MECECWRGLVDHREPSPKTSGPVANLERVQVERKEAGMSGTFF